MPKNYSIHCAILCFSVAGMITGIHDQHESAQAVQRTLSWALTRYNTRSKVESWLSQSGAIAALYCMLEGQRYSFIAITTELE